MYPLLLLTLPLTADAFSFPFTVRTTSTPRLTRRGGIPISNNGNAAYITNMTIAGASVSVILDTGSSDLWVAFPGSPPTATTDTGKSLSLAYAVGSASGNIHTGQIQFDNFTVENQAFLQVANASSFSTDTAYNGLLGLGPNEGSAIQGKLGTAGDTLLNRIFQENKTTANYITFLLDRKNDPGEPFTGQFTIGIPAAGYENITSQAKLNVETVHKLLDDQQHWQALTTKDQTHRPQSPRRPDGRLPRDMSDAIYGRVQGAVYDSTNEWWTVPLFGGVAFPIHPLDVVDDNFKILDKNGNPVCIGAFQPITSAFSLFGNFDMIMGMTFLRNAYALMDFGDWVDGASVDTGDPYIQLLPLTDATAAHADFVKVRLAGMQHSPVSAEEKKKKYEELVLSRWPYILVGCLVGVALIVGLIIWRCCCRRGKGRQKSQTYLPLQVQGSPGAPHPQGGYPHQQQGYGGQPAYGAQQGYGGQPGY
ncbi:aspartic peptidase A1 [Mycena alexandri]|uniref:Aspartic peptidase A1 n=1 Tax=Mycena alexandri TaxID=1745969 RepID=A0AAD6SLT9_9AGAR|nr:aspartic peptidase A1 [Mycena alexandri]